MWHASFSSYLLWSELVVRLQTSFLGAVSAIHGIQLWVLSLETNFLHWLWLDDLHGSCECKWMCSAERRLSSLGSELHFWYLLQPQWYRCKRAMFCEQLQFLSVSCEKKVFESRVECFRKLLMWHFPELWISKKPKWLWDSRFWKVCISLIFLRS